MRVTSVLLRAASIGFASTSAHVLVRRGVEDHGGPVLLEQLAHLRLVPRVAEHRRRRVESAIVDELTLDLEQPRLAVVDQDEPGRAHARDLAAELGADGAAGAGDEHDLAREVPGDRRDVGVDGLAPEEVLHLDGPQLAREVEVSGDQLVQARERLHRHVP